MIKRVTPASLTTLVRVVALCGAPTAPAVAHQTSTRTTTNARRRRQRWTARLVTALLLVAAGSLVSPPASHAGGPKLTTMTRNLYLGTGLDNTLAAPEFPRVCPSSFARLGARRRNGLPHSRAKALAAEILRAKPDVVGLQEVSLWRDQTPSDIVTGTTGPNATHVVYDFLALLQAELTAGGTPYTAVSTSTNADIEAPRSNSASPNGFTDVRANRPRRHSGSHRAGRQVQREPLVVTTRHNSRSRRLSGPSPSPGAGVFDPLSARREPHGQDHRHPPGNRGWAHGAGRAGERTPRTGRQ